ncbi:hypothetical protein [Pseudomonas sp. GW456-12-1-14-TSB6]|uniref:hypothetical protein n=1 Tax=unclassified Pseudomonas TaxID=196821 RepID=UPI002113B6ED|nr:hypothetical protein [Pseudomonas sp. GW456-12-1-14-TSB6]
MSRLLRKTTDAHPTLAPEPSNTCEDGPPPVESDAPIRHLFTLDAVSRLLRKTTDDGVTDYAYDPADNLLQSGRGSGYVKNNRVHVFEDKRYRYDRFGRLSEKRIGSHTVQRFRYDAEQRLVCVE